MKRIVPLFSLAVLLIACGVQPIETPLPATSTPTNAPAPAATSPSGPCRFEALRVYSIYRYPSTSAQVFSTFSTGDEVFPTHRTANGFYSFDPGTAQAGSVGIFRLRWAGQKYCDNRNQIDDPFHILTSFLSSAWSDYNGRPWRHRNAAKSLGHNPHSPTEYLRSSLM